MCFDCVENITNIIQSHLWADIENVCICVCVCQISAGTVVADDDDSRLMVYREDVGFVYDGMRRHRSLLRSCVCVVVWRFQCWIYCYFCCVQCSVLVLGYWIEFSVNYLTHAHNQIIRLWTTYWFGSIQLGK